MKYLVYGLILMAFASCKYENEEELFPNETCNTENISYSSDIQPILTKYGCEACHSTAAAQGGVILDSYEGVQTIGDNGKFVGSITHASGFSAMPPSGDKMIDCDIAKVQKWIEDGMPEN